MIELHALGSLAVVRDGTEVGLGGPRQRRLLAVLLIHHGRVVSVDRIAEATFAGEPTPAAATTLRSYVARLRRALGDDGPTVVTQAPGYRLDLGPVTFDVARFEAALAEAGRRLAQADPHGAAEQARAALACWRGDAYAESADEDWARPEAERLAELRTVAQERLVEALLAAGRADEAIPLIEGALAEHPYRESFRSHHAVALYRAGRQTDALRSLHEFRTVLAEDLGLDPSPTLVELERQVLDHHPDLAAGEATGRPLRGYRLVERLGSGRDGTVHAARLPGVERDLAVRVIRPELADDPTFVRTFDADAHRVASLRHPAIVPIHDHWREPGAAYVVMRRMHGGSLAERLERGPLSAAEVAAIAERIGGALLAAADAGVVHGRVDPAAVLFDNAGAPYLTDFRLGTGPAACAAHADGCDCDAAGFAALLRACRPGGGGVALDALLADPPPIAELVPAVVRALSPDEPVEVARPNPYKGLQAFGEADAAVFFGRAALLDELTERLASDGTRARLVLVVGGSGTGKSSAVRAGLLPRIRAGAVPGSSGWLTTTMVPGADPWHSLALALRPVAVTDEPDLAATLAGSEEALDAVLRALLPDDGQLVLVVDQFEELFTLADEWVQRQFAAALVHAITAPDSRLRVVATMRADLYDRPLAIQGLGPLVAPATVAIAAMTPSELEAAIVEPIQLVGGRVEGALLVELVDAVVREPAALPSLQFALYQLAEQAPDKVLTLADHQRLGGVSGAIASRAEAVFTALDGGSQAVVRRLFARLVVLDEVGEPARRRVSRGELASVLGPGADAVVDRLADARLLTVDRDPQTRLPTVEVAHEALLREWPRLRGWIDEDRDAIAVLDGLRDAATTWDGLGRDPGALLRGARLEVALDLVDARGEPLPPLERELLDASRAARDAEAREAAERLERQARANRRLRLQLAAIAVALVVALVGGLAALDQRRDAERERRVATARELAAAAIATLGTDPELSTLLALEAIAESRRAGGDVLREAEEALHRAVTTSRVLLRVAGTGGDVDWPDDTSTFVAEGPEESGLVEVYDATTGEVLASWTGHDVDVNEVAMSPDGALVATTGDDGALRVWDAATGELVLDVARPEWGGTTWSPVFTPDSRLVAASWLDTDWTAIFDVRTGEEVSRVDGIAGMSTSFSPDGDRLAIGLLWGPPAVVDVATGLPLLDLDVGELGVNDVAWSPDGRWIAGSDSEGMVRLFDAATGQVAFVASGHQGEVEAIDWSADASRLASVSGDGTVRIWDVGEHGAVLAHVLTTNDNRGGLMGVALSPDGDRVLTGDAAITNVTVWDVSPTGGAEWANVEVGWSWDAASFTPDGASARVRTGDGIALVDAATGEPAGLIPLVAEAAALRVRPSPDGDLLAVSGEGGPGPVRDARTGEVRWEFGDPFGFVLGMAWSGDGRYLAASLDSPGGLSIAVFDRSGEELFVRPEQEGEFTRWISMNGDGSLIATTVGGTTRNDPDEMVIRLWDWAADEVVRTIATDVPYDSATFAPSGDHLVATGWLVGIVEIWDAGTGERVATLAAPPITSSIAYSPDGTRVVTGHRDGTVRVWDAATGRQLLTLAGHQRLVTAVAVSADGSRLLSVADDGLARVWALDLDDLIELARGRSTRGFTDDECRQHLHLDRCPAA